MEGLVIISISSGFAEVTVPPSLKGNPKADLNPDPQILLNPLGPLVNMNLCRIIGRQSNPLAPLEALCCGFSVQK